MVCEMHSNQKPKCESSNGHDGTPDKDSRDIQGEQGRRPYTSIWNFIFDLEKDSTKDPIFLPFFIFLLMPLVFWTRYTLINRPEGLSIRDPNEHWDTIELAHNFVHGFGPHQAKFIDGQQDDPKAEDHSSTSWVLTSVYVLFLKSTQCFGWKTTSFELVRILHTLLAATLPFAVYKFTRAIFGQCRDVALLAAILVAFSRHLMLSSLHPYAESILSPFIFFAMTIVVNLQHGTAEDQPRSCTTIDLWSSIGVCCAGYILGVAISIQPASIATIGPMLVFLNLPKIPVTISAMWLATGGVLGIASGVTLDHVAFLILNQQSSSLPSRVTCSGPTDLSRTFSQYFGMFWGGSWFHSALVLTALAFSFLNWACTWNRSSRLTAWIANDQIWRFRTVTNLTIMSLTSSFIVSCLGRAKLDRIYDSLVLILVAGTSSLHFLYQNFYSRLKYRSKVSTTTLDVVELALYCKLGLYAWASWSCLPLDVDNSLQDVLQEGWLASTTYNGGLKYVGQQTDLAGVILDFPITMTGGRALLGRDVPMVSRMDSGWVEHCQQQDNQPWGQTLLERYNYVIVSKSSTFSVRGVHRNSGIQTFRFYDNGYRAKLYDIGADALGRAEEGRGPESVLERDKQVAGNDTEIASHLESEGGLWHLLGDYGKAKEMLAQARQLDPDKFESWRMLMESFYLQGEFDQLEKLVNHCQSLSESECDIPIR